jgi:hypothetical protein
METARIVWETFTGGSLATIKRKERIKTVIKRQDKLIKIDKNNLTYYKNLKNPWNKISPFFNMLLSLLRFMGFRICANFIVDLFTYKLKNRLKLR